MNDSTCRDSYPAALVAGANDRLHHLLHVHSFGEARRAGAARADGSQHVVEHPTHRNHVRRRILLAEPGAGNLEVVRGNVEPRAIGFAVASRAALTCVQPGADAITKTR